MIVTSFFYSGQ